jgi:hypothetical protein
MDENLHTADTTHLAKLPMHRVHLIEFHDQQWFPSFLRDYVTDALQFGFNLFKVYGPITPLLQRVLDSTGIHSIVDMCSGGGGPWLDLARKLNSRKPTGDSSDLRICLTDKYPNLDAFQKVSEASGNQITFYSGSVDATAVPRELNGLRTMFTSFHHFLPEEARAILQDAIDAGESIAIFEIPHRGPATITLTFGFVLALFVGTLWIQPFSWSRLFWTYVIPIVPFVLLFDGVVSCFRTYGPQELCEIVARLAATGYRWEIGEYPTGKTPITYLIGYSSLE